MAPTPEPSVGSSGGPAGGVGQSREERIALPELPVGTVKASSMVDPRSVETTIAAIDAVRAESRYPARLVVRLGEARPGVEPDVATGTWPIHDQDSYPSSYHQYVQRGPARVIDVRYLRWS
jgi:hypothetical protein